MLDYQTVRSWPFPDIAFDYSERDTILYALGIGLGDNPTDPRQLRFLHESDLLVVPSMATIMGFPGLWWRNPATGVDWTRTLQGDQDLQLMSPLRPAGKTIARNRVISVHDQGAGRHALVQVERDIVDAESGQLLARGRRTTVLRGHGGFSGAGMPADPPPETPSPIDDSKSPDLQLTLPILPQAALIYRLTGDLNPLHVDPAAARLSGFDRPILHGLGTFGFAARAALRALTNYDPARLRRIAARFAAPVYPGETLAFRFWRSESKGTWRFRADVTERNVLALDRGLIELQDA